VEGFISEDDLDTFEGWLRYQCINLATLTPDERVAWREMFDEGKNSPQPKVGLMKIRQVPGELLYAVAVREQSDLWLLLWVRRNRKGEFFVMVPRAPQPGAKRGWDPHNSYHLDGTRHSKSFGRKMASTKLQPLTGTFRGTVPLGAFAGYGPKTVGAICDPTHFTGVVEVASGILGPRHGEVIVDLVEPSHEPITWLNVVQTEIFKDAVPWVVIRIAKSD
jgi:hypothetical protein